MIKRSLVIGYGQIGKAIAELDSEGGYNISIIDPSILIPLEYFAYDVIHICIPCSNADEYMKIIQKYLDEYTAPLILIHTTVPLNILDKLMIDPDSCVLHCPVRGTHPNIKEGIKSHVQMVAPVFPTYVGDLEKIRLGYFTKVWNIEVKFYKNSNETALAKLLNTAWYSMQIAMANQIDRICADLDLDFKNVYNETIGSDSINSLYWFDDITKRAVGIGEKIRRPVMVPGAMNGTCLMPNIELGKEIFSENFTKWIKEMHHYGVNLNEEKTVN